MIRIGILPKNRVVSVSWARLHCLWVLGFFCQLSPQPTTTNPVSDDFSSDVVIADPVSGPFIPRKADELGYDPDLANVPPFVANILKQKQQEGRLAMQNEFSQLMKQELNKALQQTQAAAKPASVPDHVPSKPVSPKEAEKEKEKEIDFDVRDALSVEFQHADLQKRISLHVKFTPVQDVIEMISKLADIDFVIDSDVTGKVGRISCENCTVGEILQFICTTNRPQLALIRYLHMWHIMRYEKAVRFIEVRRKRDFVSRVINIYNAKFDDAFQARLKDMWKNITQARGESRAYMAFDVLHRKVFIYGLQRHIAELQYYIEQIDRHIPQVRIDMVLVLARKSYVYNFGFNWSGVYNRQATLLARGTRFGLAGVGADLREYPTPDVGHEALTQKPLVNTNLKIDPNNFSLNLYVDPTANYIKIPFIFGGSDLNTRRLNLLLNAAEAEDKIKVLSRPSVLTSDGEMAEMLIGNNIPLPTIVQDTIEGQVRNVTTTNFKSTGTHIKVRPVVNMDTKTVLLDVFIQANEIPGTLGEQIIITGSLDATKNPPVIATVRTQNKVILRSGQTTVIGGLIRNSVSRSQNEVPYLHKLPIIGWFFKAIEKTERDDEQLIFITPTIVD